MNWHKILYFLAQSLGQILLKKHLLSKILTAIQFSKDEEETPPNKEEKSMDEINETPLKVLEQNAKALDELVESNDPDIRNPDIRINEAENQLDPNEDMEIVEPPEEVDVDDEKPLVDI